MEGVHSQNPKPNVILSFQTHFFWTSLLRERIKWIKENLRADAKIMVNFRDVSDGMFKRRETIMKVVYFLSTLPSNERPFALIFEEPTGNVMPSTLGIWTSSNVSLFHTYTLYVCKEIDVYYQSQRFWKKNRLECLLKEL